MTPSPEQEAAAAAEAAATVDAATATDEALAAAQAASKEAARVTFTYPQTRRLDLVETQFGVPVADPYRWLENDVRNDAEVKAWVDAQNVVHSRPITESAELPQIYLVSSGLKDDERILLEGLRKVRDGTVIEPEV